MGSGSSTVTLVGDLGVGKTTCAYAFAERLLDDKSVAKKLRYSQVVALDAPALLAQVKGPGELESLVIRLLNEAHKAKNIILFFDDAHVFFSNGPSSVDLSNVLQPALDSGSVRLIFAMTPREWQQISGSNGSVASKLQAVQVREPDETETIHVLRDQILTIEYQRKAVFTFQALREAYRLGSRYIDSQVMPGAALSVLTGAASIAKDGYVTDAVVKQSIESSVGVKLQQVNHDETQTLLHLEDELHKYVINQKRAVSVIANALRRSRSGVGNPERPIGTFLFLGPTGVGKTELSKALARVYFGNVDSIVRVDMNQYVQPSDVNRLITPMLGDQLGFLGQVLQTVESRRTRPSY
jgi:ATP-dependent Clp protease ATP-binding subunit ClpC